MIDYHMGVLDGLRAATINICQCVCFVGLQQLNADAGVQC